MTRKNPTRAPFIERIRYSFNACQIARAPAEPGVFVLWDDDEPIYVGRTSARDSTIRSALIDHWVGFLGPRSQSASHFSFEKSRRPAAREAEVWEELSRLPRSLSR